MYQFYHYKKRDTKFDLFWTKVDDATRYIIYRKPNNGSYKKVLTLGGDVYLYTTSIMKPGTYEFIVKAGRYDSIDCIMTQNSNVVEGISKFTSLTIKLNKTNSNNVKITWNALEEYKYYEVYRSSSNGGSYIKTTSALSYTDKDLKKGNSYYYKIKGYRMMNDKKSIWFLFKCKICQYIDYSCFIRKKLNKESNYLY